ncbi:radical SAM family heme chaperone HemW [Mogibacterium sp.]
MTTNKNPGIYVHIPFCVRKCNYCAFLSGSSDEALRERYVKALCEEIRIRARRMSDHAHGVFDTIFFGGGTPSLLTSEQIARIIAELRVNFNIDSEAEITLESNPKALSMESLKGYHDAGVNRLSMGVQSMNDDILKRLGRIHTAHDVIRDVQNAREAGFDNLNLDLMFAVPGSSLETTLIDIEAVTNLEPEHISFYSLQLEEGTAFFKEFEQGELTEVPDEIDRAMYHAGTKLLKEKGYEHYEISNFAKRGYESRHNLKYWEMAPYLGLGLGASLFIDNSRVMNVCSLDEYFNLTGKGLAPSAEVHENSEHDNVAEAVFTGLRKVEGIRYEDVLGSYEEFWEYYSDVFEEALEYEREGKLVICEDGMRLTDEGIDISNSIMALFV